MRTCSLFATFVLLSASAVGSNGEDKLLSVVTLYRHGDRTPVDSYPTDPYNASFWKIGYGQLTNKGKLQLFQLGQWLRRRYDGFLPERYNASDIYVRSSDIDRTLMSAQACLAGLYPPKAEQIWNEHIDWQPIPVHTIPSSTDGLLYFMNCPRHTKLTELNRKLEVFKRLHYDNKDLFKYVSEKTGRKVNTLFDMVVIWDDLNVDRTNNLQIPEWAKDVYDRMTNLAVWGLVQFSWTKEEQRLCSGQVFQLLINRFNRTISGDANVEKMLMLSSHDLNIVNVLNTLGKFDWTMPPHAATLIFELKTDGRTNYIDISYKKENVLKRIDLNYCKGSCTLNQFTQLVKSIAINEDDWRRECTI